MRPIFSVFTPRPWEELPFDRNAHQMGRASSWAPYRKFCGGQTDCSRVRRLNWTWYRHLPARDRVSKGSASEMVMLDQKGGEKQ